MNLAFSLAIRKGPPHGFVRRRLVLSLLILKCVILKMLFFDRFQLTNI
ncbi:hypothetical protein ANACOL_01093 [Anaerotruncus colihominis DSM 17241]|uniref:Uncharacterized protein n=1 Tax=Anaerotruncus colihominis DSM 17241 TaxID=445972 RepID=B0P8K4_9FIRM|nr:hypothetical protein ANACOL_01093 [Anaerotruncus colihominis DSM 17241]